MWIQSFILFCGWRTQTRLTERPVLNMHTLLDLTPCLERIERKRDGVISVLLSDVDRDGALSERRHFLAIDKGFLACTLDPSMLLYTRRMRLRGPIRSMGALNFVNWSTRRSRSIFRRSPGTSMFGRQGCAKGPAPILFPLKKSRPPQSICLEPIHPSRRLIAFARKHSHAAERPPRRLLHMGHGSLRRPLVLSTSINQRHHTRPLPIHTKHIRYLYLYLTSTTASIPKKNRQQPRRRRRSPQE